MPNNLNQGVLFKNDKMSSDKAPAYTGSANIGGKDYRIAAWVQPGKDGGKSFFTFKFEEPQNNPQGSTYQRPTVKPGGNDDGLPF